MLVAATVLRLVLVGHDVPTLNSDEAVVGLMGLHLLRGEWTTFYWGQEYMGSLEALLAAPLIATIGASVLALRLTMLALTLGFLATVYALGSRLYAPWVGLASALLLALGPPFFVVASMRALGGYMETLLFGNVVLLLALAGATPSKRTHRASLLTGVLMGLALWTNMLVLPFLLAAGLLYWWQRRSDLLPWRGHGSTLVAGTALGMAPALVYNVLHGGGTIGSVLGFTLIGGNDPPSSPLLLLEHLWLVITVSLPILAGSSFGGTQIAGYFPREYYQHAAAHPVIYGVCLALSVAVVVLLAQAAVRAVRDWRTLRVLEGAVAGEGVIRRQGEAALALAGVAYIGAFCLTKDLYNFSSPRYLLPLYAVTPVLVGTAPWLKGLVDARWHAARRVAGPWPAALALALLVVWYIAGNAALTPQLTAARDHGIPVYGRDTALLALLRAHRVRTVISNDYWEGLRLTYESGETIIAVMVTPSGYLGFNRYKPYIARGLADPRPAYVQLVGTREALLAVDRLSTGDLRGYTEHEVDGFVVLVPG